MDEPAGGLRKLGPDDASAARGLIERFHDSSVSEDYLRGLLSDANHLLVVAEAEGPDRFASPAPPASMRATCSTGCLERASGLSWEDRAADGWSEGRSSGEFKPVGAPVTNEANEAAVALYTSMAGSAKNGDDLLFVFPAG